MQKAHWGGKEAVAAVIVSDPGQDGSGHVVESQCFVAQRNDEQHTAVAGAVLAKAAAVPHPLPLAGQVALEAVGGTVLAKAGLVQCPLSLPRQDALEAAEGVAVHASLAAQLLAPAVADSLDATRMVVGTVCVGGAGRGR